jgi:hypothetical protein
MPVDLIGVQTPTQRVCDRAVRLFQDPLLAEVGRHVLLQLEELHQQSRADLDDETCLALLRRLDNLLLNEGLPLLARVPDDVRLTRELATIRGAASNLRATLMGDATLWGGDRLGNMPARKEPGQNPSTRKPIDLAAKPLSSTTRGAKPNPVVGRAQGTRKAKKSATRQNQPSSRKGAEDSRPVLLGVSAPSAVKRAESFTARFAAYVKEVELAVKERLVAMADVESASGFTPHDAANWKVGTRIQVRVTGDHVSAEPVEVEFEWNGSENITHFQVRARANAPFGKTQLRFEAFIAGVRVALIVVDIMVSAASAPSRSTTHATPHKRFFASYARADTERVADHLTGLHMCVRETDIFMDCLDIKRNEDWRERLASEIAEVDTFLLFWSKAAAESEWVDWEWRRAHERQIVQVLRLDQPEPALPQELARLHADDRFQLARRAHRE